MELASSGKAPLLSHSPQSEQSTTAASEATPSSQSSEEAFADVAKLPDRSIYGAGSRCPGVPASSGATGGPCASGLPTTQAGMGHRCSDPVLRLEGHDLISLQDLRPGESASSIPEQSGARPSGAPTGEDALLSLSLHSEQSGAAATEALPSSQSSEEASAEAAKLPDHSMFGAGSRCPGVPAISGATHSISTESGAAAPCTPLRGSQFRSQPRSGVLGLPADGASPLALTASGADSGDALLSLSPTPGQQIRRRPAGFVAKLVFLPKGKLRAGRSPLRPRQLWPSTDRSRSPPDA